MPDSVVVISGASDLADLDSRAANASELVLFGCHVDSLDGVEKLAHLRTLKVLASTVTDLSALAKCKSLEELDVLFCGAKDASPLLQIKSLRRASLMGNPWLKESFEKVRPKLANAEWDSEPLWQLNLLFEEKGLEVSGGSSDAGIWFVKRGAEASGEVQRFTAVQYQIKQALDAAGSGLTYDGLKQALPNAQFSTTDDWKALDPSTTHVKGEQNDALQWLDKSELPEDYKKDLAKFIRRFPTLRFVRYGASVLDKVEQRDEIKLPDWYRQTLEQVLATVGPESTSFEVKYGSKWLRVGPMGYHGRDQKALFRDKAQLFPIAENEAGDEGLALQLSDPGSVELREYSARNLSKKEEKGQPIEGHKGPASFAQFLVGVSAIRVDGKEVPAAD